MKEPVSILKLYCVLRYLFVVELDVLHDVDPAFSLLKYNRDEHGEEVLELIQQLKEQKQPVNPIMRWLY